MGLYMGTGGMDDLKWVAFSMSNASIHGDRGVSSITRHGAGRHEIVFDGNMAAQGQYAVVANGQYEWSVGPWNNNLNNYEVGNAYTWHGRYAAGTAGDIGYMAAVIIGE